MANSDVANISLREIFTPLIARVLLFLRTAPCAPQVFAEIRREITSLLEEQRTLLRRSEISTQDYDSAQFAVVAWVDEILSSPKYGIHPEVCAQWQRTPLQAEMYKTTRAGEEFYKRLEQLRPVQKEVYELYYLCLCLGFRGRYYDEERDDNKLRDLKRECAQYLPLQFSDLIDLEKDKVKVTPQPYSVPAPAYTPPAGAVSPLWLGIPLLGLLALLVYLLWPQPGLLSDVEKILAGFKCHAIKVTDIHDGNVRLIGRVQDQEQSDQVQKALLKLPGITKVEATFDFLAWPFCEVVDLLTPFQHRSASLSYNLGIRPQQGCETVYIKDEKLVVDITATKPLRHVYIDYFAADKKLVTHLLPSKKQSADISRDATTVTIGNDPTIPPWTIDPPFGKELITVIASPQPLFQNSSFAPEPARSYVDTLRRALPQDPNTSDTTAAYCFITSREQ